MPNPTLRELVDMLPPEMQTKALRNFVWCDGSWGRNHPNDCGGTMSADEDEVADAILGYLHRWLGQRGWFVKPFGTGYMGFGVRSQGDAIYPTPIEAAVRTVGVVWKQ